MSESARIKCLVTLKVLSLFLLLSSPPGPDAHRRNCGTVVDQTGRVVAELTVRRDNTALASRAA